MTRYHLLNYLFLMHWFDKLIVSWNILVPIHSKEMLYVLILTFLSPLAVCRRHFSTVEHITLQLHSDCLGDISFCASHNLVCRSCLWLLSLSPSSSPSPVCIQHLYASRALCDLVTGHHHACMVGCDCLANCLSSCELKVPSDKALCMSCRFCSLSFSQLLSQCDTQLPHDKCLVNEQIRFISSSWFVFHC